VWPLRWGHQDPCASSDVISGRRAWLPCRLSLIFDFSRHRPQGDERRWITDLPQLPLGQLLKEVKPSTISTAQLHWLPSFHMPPIKQVISLRSYPVNPVGNLISRRASHLDAFSAYLSRT
jgi:hypothetical protein